MKDSFKKLLTLSDRNIKENPFSTRKNLPLSYMKEIVGEIEEVKNEYKNNNSIYLEDELGDVLWDYLMVLQSLKKDGYIDSIDKVFDRAVEKYSERMEILDLDDRKDAGALWSKIKRGQKKILRDRHYKKYNK